MAKGIRVNQLAKELGVESKAILSKCRDEGLGEKVPNHMSVLSIGLAETVREWFAGGGGGVGTAVETAAPVDVATRPRRTVRKKRVDGSDEEPQESTTIEEPREVAPIEEPVSAPVAPSVIEAPPARARC